jgi:lysophospholipase L1-like esterase
MFTLLAIGDCNTLGAGPSKGKSYPEIVAEKLGGSCENCGQTMFTTREGVAMLRDTISSHPTHITIQFGIADSYLTFSYAPYVLYYPDNFLRKQCRSIVKKYKKICRKGGIDTALGKSHLVPPDEYEENLSAMVRMCKGQPVVLLETVPNLELYRNAPVEKFNKITKAVAEKFDNCRFLPLYQKFYENLDTFFFDTTHVNSRGNEYIANRLVEMIEA